MNTIKEELPRDILREIPKNEDTESEESNHSDDDTLSGQNVAPADSSDSEGSSGSGDSGVEKDGHARPQDVLRTGQSVRVEVEGGVMHSCIICFIDKRPTDTPSWIMISTMDTQCKKEAIVYNGDKIGWIDYVKTPFAFVRLYPNTYRMPTKSGQNPHKLNPCSPCSPEEFEQALKRANCLRQFRDHISDDISRDQTDRPVRSARGTLRMSFLVRNAEEVHLRPGAPVVPHVEGRSPPLSEWGILHEVHREKNHSATYINLLPIFEPLSNFVTNHVRSEVHVELPLPAPALLPAATATPLSSDASATADSGVGTAESQNS